MKATEPLALESMVKLLDGGTLPDLVPIETVLVNTSTIDQYEEAALRRPLINPLERPQH